MRYCGANIGRAGRFDLRSSLPSEKVQQAMKIRSLLRQHAAIMPG